MTIWLLVKPTFITNLYLPECRCIYCWNRLNVRSVRILNYYRRAWFFCQNRICRFFGICSCCWVDYLLLGRDRRLEQWWICGIRGFWSWYLAILLKIQRHFKDLRSEGCFSRFGKSEGICNDLIIWRCSYQLCFSWSLCHCGCCFFFWGIFFSPCHVICRTNSHSYCICCCY